MAPILRRESFSLAVALLICSLAASPAAADAPTAYEMLEKYGFPKGILPEGATSYVLREDKTFEVHLGGRGDCDFARKISGRLDEAAGALTELKGVSVKVLFVWFGIGEVVKGQNSLSFYVGPLSASFPLSNFEDCPRCRCGFNCSPKPRRKPPPPRSQIHRIALGNFLYHSSRCLSDS
ncbi:unnamed protein product [Spirodela intermedia]|uniref:Uncharacterized protein n=1 Tax=Spirodela intermedia TaxID=51605 RepID=A0A7I8J289_SPIIN|nr:unnamed protein product [Spirodela intermedia]CAA6663923.1 unnamed protein product [Spirodela intermedia]